MSDCDESWVEGFYGDGRPRKTLKGEERKSTSAARWLYAQHHGLSLSDMAGLVVRHTCDNGGCVNVAHLVIGTHMQNVTDSMERGRHSAGERHGMAKLTRGQVEEIRRRYVRGTSRWQPGNRKELEREFGVSQSQVSAIVNGSRWAIGFAGSEEAAC